MADGGDRFAGYSVELFRLVAEHSAIGMCLVSPEGRFEWVNPAMCRLMGRSSEELLGMTFADVTHQEDLGASMADAERMRRGLLDSTRTLKRYLRRDGSVLWGDLSVACLRAADGSVEFFVSQVLDVTAEVEAQRALTESQERYRLLAENASDVVTRSDAAGILRWVSPSVTELFGWTPDQLLGTRAFDLLHPDDLPDAEEQAISLRAGRPTSTRVRIRCADGRYRWISATARPLFDAVGHYLGRVVGWRDASAEVAAEEALAASEAHYRLLAENATDVIITVDGAGCIAWVSPSTAMVLGWPAYEMLGVPLADLLHPEDTAGGCPGLGAGSAARGRCEVRVRTFAGEWLWMSDAWHLLPPSGDPDEPRDGAVHSLRDISSEREAREALQFLAYHDALTRLANRAVAQTRLEQVLAHDRRGTGPAAVMFVDIDNLKAINDSLGHEAGDHAIHTIAQRLLRNARSEDLVARFGGDEFLVILASVGSWHDVQAAAERFRSDAAQPMLLQDRSVQLSVSIGVAMAEPGSEPSDVLRRADAALYRAKRSGRDRTAVDAVLWAAGDT